MAAVRAYLDDRPDLAVEHLKALDKPNQELMLQLIPAVVKGSRASLTRAGPHDLGVLLVDLTHQGANVVTEVQPDLPRDHVGILAHELAVDVVVLGDDHVPQVYPAFEGQHLKNTTLKTPEKGKVSFIILSPVR